VIEFKFHPWSPIRARMDKTVIAAALRDAAMSTAREMRAGMRGPKTGRVYSRRGKTHQASAPRVEYPAIDSGALVGSITSTFGAMREETGATAKHGKFLREGHTKMARRKMSDTALTTVLPSVMARMKPFAHFVKGKT
jgi:hypothetical protein